MKSAANSIVYTVRTLAICSALFGTWLAQGEERCALSYPSPHLKPEDVQALTKKGYSPRAVPYIGEDLISLRKVTDTKLWALVPDKSGLNVVYEMPDGNGSIPLMRFHYVSVDAIPACEILSKQIKYTNGMRLNISRTFPALRGEGQLLEAFLKIEELDADLKKTKHSPDLIRSHLEGLKSEASRVWTGSAGRPYGQRLHEVRKVLLAGGLLNYCRDFPRFHDLATRNCTNCVGQTLLWLGILDHLQAENRDNKFGFIHYEDHLQPVWINERDEHIDLVYNKLIDRSLKVSSAKELIALGIERWRNLILAGDKIDPKVFNTFASHEQPRASGQLVSSTEGVIYNWGRLPSVKKRFTETPAPEFADLSGLANVNPDRPALAHEVEAPRRDSSRPQGGLTDFCYIGSPREFAAISETLHPEDQKTAAKYVRLYKSNSQMPCEELGEFRRKNPYFALNNYGNEYNYAPLYRLEVSDERDEPGARLGLPFRYSKLTLTNEETSKWERFETLIFFEPADFEEYRGLRYWARMERIKSVLRPHIMETLPPAIQRARQAIESSQPILSIAKDAEFWTALGTNLQTVIPLANRFEMNNELRKSMEGFANAMKVFSYRLGVDSALYMSQFNSLSDEDIGKILSAFNSMPFASFMGETKFHFPLQRLFVNSLRDPKNWNISDSKVEMRFPEGPQKNLIADLSDHGLPAIDLPKVNLPCGQQGYLSVVCPSTAPRAGQNQRLKAKLLAGLSMLHPHVFLNPGDLLMLTQLWTPEVYNEFALFADLWKDADQFNRTFERSEIVNMALKEQVKIIRGETPDHQLSGAIAAKGVRLQFNVSQKSRDGLKISAKPSWLKQNPVYAQLIGKIGMTPHLCGPAPEFDSEIITVEYLTDPDPILRSVYMGHKKDLQAYRIKAWIGQHYNHYLMLTTDGVCWDRYRVFDKDDAEEFKHTAADAQADPDDLLDQ